MCCTNLCGGVNTNTDAIGFQTHCVCVGASVGKGKICVGQCEHTIMGHLIKYKSKQTLHCSLCVKGRGGSANRVNDVLHRLVRKYFY